MGPPIAKALRFEDVAVGHRAERAAAVPAGALDDFARLSGDWNPLHADAVFARERGFPGRVAHGLFVGSIFSSLVGMELPGRDCLLQSARFEFKRAVLEGETLIFSVEVVQKVEALRVLVLDAKAVGDDGQVRVSGRLQVGFTA